MKKIIVDMDGIVVDLDRKWLAAYNKDWGDTLKPEDVTSWNKEEFVNPDCGRAIYDYIKRRGFFDDLKPYAGAIESVTKLVEAGHEVKIASKPPGADACRAKVEWIEDHFKHLNWGIKDMFLCDAKFWIEADWMIDDSPNNARKWKNKPGAKMAMIAHPYNKSVEDIVDIYAEGYKDTAKAWDTIVKGILG